MFGCMSSFSNDSQEGTKSMVSVALNICARAVGDAEVGMICLAFSVADRPTNKEKRENK